MRNGNTHKLVASAVRLVELVAEKRDPMNISSLAKELSLSYASTYRILHTLLAAGWVAERAEGGYQLAGGLFQLLDPEMRASYLMRQLKEPLGKLAGECGLTVKLTVRQANSCVAVFRIDAPGRTAVTQRVGSKVHLAAGATGPCLMAAFDDPTIHQILDTAPPEYWQHQTRTDVLTRIKQVRAKRFCLGFSHEYPELRSIASPIVDAAGDPVAAVTLMGFASDFRAERLAHLSSRLLALTKKYSVKSGTAAPSLVKSAKSPARKAVRKTPRKRAAL
ncbi:MAG: IclR family transcriptional regulator [Opitutaceae bacterium]